MRPNLRRQVLRSVALVWLDDLVGIKLRVGIRRVDDELLGIVDDTESSEAIACTELSRPAGADGVATAGDVGSVLLAGGGARDGEFALGLGRGVGVDAEGPDAGGVGRVADTLHVCDRPPRIVGYS